MAKKDWPHVVIPEDLHTAMKKACLDLGVEMNQLASEILSKDVRISKHLEVKK